MVVFEGGRPRNSEYRRFKIKTVEGANDFASHQEVLRRRFRKAAAEQAVELEAETSAAIDGVTEKAVAEERGSYGLNEVEALEQVDNEPAALRSEDSEEQSQDSGEEARQVKIEAAAEEAEEEKQDGKLQHEWALPDLVIIDGGKGQLGAAMEVMRELGLTDIPTVGLAKEREEIFTPGAAVGLMLPREGEALHLVQRIRDEAHRFAIGYHRKLRSKKAFKSKLDDIPGIGPRRKAALLRHFGSLSRIRAATVEELAAAPGMNRAAAVKLKDLL
jgi:excinuclease ABC subunit C